MPTPTTFKVTALDCETTGLDLFHGALPFFVTLCDTDGRVVFYEWDVDPLTRKPVVPLSDIEELLGVVKKSSVVCHNLKFDSQALTALDNRFKSQWPWKLSHDTLLASHLLSSNTPHDLTATTLIYLGINIQPLEDRLEQAVKEAKKIAKRKYPDWQLATAGRADMPSAKDTVWKFDSWLPRAIAKHEGYDLDHPWWTVLAEYSNADSASTIELFKKQKQLLEERGLWPIYEERRKLLPIVFDMEQRGVTINSHRLDQLMEEYTVESENSAAVCLGIAQGNNYDLELPKGGSNNSLRTFLLDVLKLQPNKKSKKTGEPSLDKTVIEHWEANLPEGSEELEFIQALGAKRKRDTAIAYMEGYKRFWLPLASSNDRRGVAIPSESSTRQPSEWYVLHPSLNPTGTDTLRWSSQNPNEQNISKKRGFNLRYCFGPTPGREWWACDYSNLELRIPAYEAGEEEMIRLFEHPEEPPYFGSYHMLVFDILHPKEFALHGEKCKEIYASTLYQWTKNGNFAVQYGAVEQSGTADRAYHVKGAQGRIQDRFSRIKALNQSCIDYAKKTGYVETIPDKSIGCTRGYPLLCTRTRWGGILETVPLNYHVQGTAMWITMKAMIRCHKQLQEWQQQGFNGFMVLQVHDEIVFDLPASEIEIDEEGSEILSNLPLVQQLCKLMEQSGDDVGVPLKVEPKYHPQTWSEGVSV